MSCTVTTSNASCFSVGQYITVTGLTPFLPHWVMKWPWQDGDQAIVRWFYKVVGWKLPTSYQAKITGISSATEFTIKA